MTAAQRVEQRNIGGEGWQSVAVEIVAAPVAMGEHAAGNVRADSQLYCSVGGSTMCTRLLSCGVRAGMWVSTNYECCECVH